MKRVELMGEKLFAGSINKHSAEVQLSVLNIATGEWTTEKSSWWLLTQDDYYAIKDYVRKLEMEISEHREIEQRSMR